MTFMKDKRSPKRKDSPEVVMEPIKKKTYKRHFSVSGEDAF